MVQVIGQLLSGAANWRGRENRVKKVAGCRYRQPATFFNLFKRRLDVTAQFLFALNSCKECLEVTLTKARCALSLNDFIE